MDGRDWDAVAELFVADGVLVMPDPPRSLEPVVEASGAASIRSATARLTGFTRTFHHVTGCVWRSEGTVALGRTTSVAHHVEDGVEPRSWTWHVVYQDRCVRTPAGWRFARRELTVVMIEARTFARVLPFAAAPDP